MDNPARPGPAQPITGWWFNESIQSGSHFSEPKKFEPGSARLNPSRVDYLVSQFNPAHILASQKSSNPAQPITGWWVKRVDSRVHLIKKIQFIYFFFNQN